MRHRKQSFGFTIVELLISLAITAILLTAVAVAFNASVINYTTNESILKTVNTARQALFRMTSQIRTGLVDANDMSADSCRLLCADGSDMTYQYNSSDQKLYVHNNTTGDDYLLCDNVTALTFTKDDNTPTGDIKSVQIAITVESDNVEQKLAGAAVVRRVLN
jgi:prepilin-type N-terminal cleavage/methylation domain-containing protein